jgi:hypothetical protein
MTLRLNPSVSSSYAHLAITFFIMATIVTVVRGVFRDIFKEDYLNYLAPLVAPFGVLFLIFMIRLVRKLGVSDRMIRFILFLLITAVVFRAASILSLRVTHIGTIFGLLSSTMLILMQSISVYFMCNNLFIQENPIKEKLWASVCVYFMIGATFGTLYSLLLIVNPSGFGAEITRPAEIFIMGLVYSFNIISGMDPVYEGASETIRMTAVLESIFTMLFMVILIGRLLGSKD